MVNIMKRKIMLALIALVTVCLAVSAVSAWEFSFGGESSSSTKVGSDGDVANIEYNNGVLKINDKEFKIPSGYTQDTNLTKTGENANLTGIDAKMSRATFINGDKAIIVKCIYSDKDITTYNPTTDGAQNKTIGGHAGVLEKNKDGTVFFSYIDDGKLIQIESPDEDTLNQIPK